MPSAPMATAPSPTESGERRLQPFEALDACHQQILVQLDTLERLVAHLETHGVDEQAQAWAREVFSFFMSQAHDHHQQEEQHVFPSLIQSGDARLMDAVLRLQQDHGWIEEDWQELAPQLDAMAAGYHWYNLDLLRHAIPVFKALYLDHIALEESLAYPEAKARLAAWEQHGQGRELARRKRSAPSPNTEVA